LGWYRLETPKDSNGHRFKWVHKHCGIEHVLDVRVQGKYTLVFLGKMLTTFDVSSMDRLWKQRAWGFRQAFPNLVGVSTENNGEGVLWLSGSFAKGYEWKDGHQRQLQSHSNIH
jgi:hypothetical protein